MPEDVIVQNQGNEPTGYPAEASREMMEAGIFYGRKKSKTNPRMRPFILANRGGIEIINLQKTEELVAEAAAFVKEKVRQGGLVLIVGTEPAAEASLVAIAKRFGIPYVTGRWVGGAITNFKVVAKRIEYMKKLRADFATGALVGKYTKKERLSMEREMQRLEELMGGFENMTREPDLLIVIDPVLHDTAVHEARMKKIPVVALANVDADPDEVDYLVPGNDRAKKSIEWFLQKMEQAIEEGMKERAKVQAEGEAAKAAVAEK